MNSINFFFVQTPKYQNSYRLEAKKPFNVESVDKIVKQVMINNLEDIVYDPKECPKLCAEISADIRNRICKQNFDRYTVYPIITPDVSFFRHHER